MMPRRFKKKEITQTMLRKASSRRGSGSSKLCGKLSEFLQIGLRFLGKGKKAGNESKNLTKRFKLSAKKKFGVVVVDVFKSQQGLIANSTDSASD